MRQNWPELNQIIERDGWQAMRQQAAQFQDRYRGDRARGQGRRAAGAVTRAGRDAGERGWLAVAGLAGMFALVMIRRHGTGQRRAPEPFLISRMIVAAMEGAWREEQQHLPMTNRWDRGIYWL